MVLNQFIVTAYYNSVGSFRLAIALSPILRVAAITESPLVWITFSKSNYAYSRDTPNPNPLAYTIFAVSESSNYYTPCFKIIVPNLTYPGSYLLGTVLTLCSASFIESNYSNPY